LRSPVDRPGDSDAWPALYGIDQLPGQLIFYGDNPVRGRLAAYMASGT